MIARSLKAKILVFAVFFIGIATGVLIANFYTSRVTGTPADVANTGERAQRARRDVSRFRDYLGLNETQREQMDKIMEETRSEFRKLREETQPRFQAIEMESRSKVRAILNDEQLQKYDEFRRNMDQKRRDREQRQRPNK
ncbi:MAG TPA: hypothetical protein VE422_31975 [Terriglobia bacterium]|nr:hypothetical protein [Terriglobia bacterium]